MPVIDNSTFAEWLDDGGELAVLDIRPRADVSYYGEPLFGTNLPADYVLEEIHRFVPRRKVRTVLVDGGDGRGAELAAAPARKGMAGHPCPGGRVSRLAGRRIFQPVLRHSRQEIFSRRAEHDTPVVTVGQLKKRREQGEDIVVIDTRTVPEYARNHVPGAVNVPGAELLLRYTEIVPSADTQIVVSCAGLPRAILGAQTLIDAGVPNPVAYLHDGTAAWRRAGWELEEGLTARYHAATERSRKFGRHHAAQFSTAGRFPEIDLATARAWAADPDRTTYLLDVRTPEEFAAEHIAEIAVVGGRPASRPFQPHDRDTGERAWS